MSDLADDLEKARRKCDDLESQLADARWHLRQLERQRDAVFDRIMRSAEPRKDQS